MNYFQFIIVSILVVGALLFGSYIGTHRHAVNPFNPTSPNVVTVTFDGGGEIFSFYQKYTDMRIQGKNLRIEGLCASACTYFLNTMPHDRVCATEYAKFGFHGIYTMFLGQKIPNFKLYSWFSSIVYPQLVLDKLVNEYGFDGSKADVDEEKYPAGLIFMNRDDLRIKHCES